MFEHDCFQPQTPVPRAAIAHAATVCHAIQNTYPRLPSVATPHQAKRCRHARRFAVPFTAPRPAAAIRRRRVTHHDASAIVIDAAAAATPADAKRENHERRCSPVRAMRAVAARRFFISLIDAAGCFMPLIAHTPPYAARRRPLPPPPITPAAMPIPPPERGL